MLITNREIKELEDSLEISASIDDFRFWYRVPKSFAVSRAGDPFLAAALLPAMLKGEPLQIDPGLPVSPKLLKNLSVLQEIHCCWNPILKVIPINARIKAADPLNMGAMSFFSGGVDSMFTFIKHREDISHLVFIQGFDFFTGAGEALSFTAADISDLGQIAYKLDAARDPVSAFVKTMLSETARAALSKYRESSSDAGALEEALAKDFQKIIVGQPIYQEQRFARIGLRPETRQLLAHPPDGESLPKLNRLLLEDAYSLEIARKNSSIYETAITRNANFARSFGKVLIPVATNYYPFSHRYHLSRLLTQGSILASIALLLGFPRVYLPGAVSYSQLIPIGSHPLTDQLWSNECVEIIHDGAEARRVDKVKKIAECEPALRNLRVCWNRMNVNCGKCAKCLRTMIPLKLLGVSTASFPPLPPLKAIREMRIDTILEMMFFKENFELALQTGDEELRDALSACMRRYERRQLFKEFDRVFLSGLIKRVYRKREKEQARFKRILTTPSQD